LFSIAPTNFDQSDTAMPLERIGEREWSRSDGGKNWNATIKRVAYNIAKGRGPKFHWPDFVKNDQPACAECFTNGVETDSFQRGKIESIFSQAL
jgi:hypothetical protein